MSLADYAGRKLVLFFYPRADTPGCTREAIDFTRLAADFAAAGAAVLGVSADPVKAQDKFRDKHELRFRCSPTRITRCSKPMARGAKNRCTARASRGSPHDGSDRRDGRIARIWRNVRVDGHADAVLAAAARSDLTASVFRKLTMSGSDRLVS